MSSGKQGTIRRRSKARDALTIQVSLGSDPETGKRRFHTETVHGTEEDANFRIAQVRRDYGRGVLPDSSNLTVADYLEGWLRTHGSMRLRPRTLQGYQDHVRRYILPRIGHLQLSRLAVHHVRDMEADLLRKGGRGGAPLSARTVLHAHRVLSSALTQAVRSDLVPRNVAALVDPPRAGRHEFRTLTFQQVRDFLDGIRNPLHRSIILLSVQTGLRRSEVLGLQWRDVNWETGALSVRRSVIELRRGEVTISEPKSGRGRVIPLVGDSLNLLGSLREDSQDEGAFIFSRPDGRPLVPLSVTRAFRRARDRAGLEGLRLHDLRHTHASLMLAAGIHPKVVSERLGHSSVGITLDTYSHVLPTVQEEAADRFGEAWRAAGRGGAPRSEKGAPEGPDDVKGMSNSG